MNDPIASFDNIRYRPNSRAFAGKRGTAGQQATLLTAMTGTNNDLLIYSKRPHTTANQVKIQLANIGNWVPLRVYDGGSPAFVTITPGAGTPFNLIAKVPGSKGNSITVTLIDPGGTTSNLTVSVVNQYDIQVFLGRAANAITSTAFNVVSAINLHTTANALVEASLAIASSGAVAAVAKTSLTGGADDPNLCFVQLNTASNGSVNSTGRDLVAALAGSTLVGALNAPGNDGSGAVTVLGSTALTGATQTIGDIFNTSETRRLDHEFRNTHCSTSMNRQTDVGVIERLTRTGVPRGMKNVTAADRAQYTAYHGNINLQQEHGPRSPYL
jgi:hypothetical protein